MPLSAPSVSTIPDVLDALVALTSAALPGVTVFDAGPTTDTPDDVVLIGYSEDDGEVVESVRTAEQLGGTPDRERYEITCLASSWSGGAEPSAVRRRAYELINAIAAGLKADKTLGGLVLRARLSAEGLRQEQTDKGPAATVRFSIHVDAFTTR